MAVPLALVAESVTGVEADTCAVATLKVAVVLPGGTVTLNGGSISVKGGMALSGGYVPVEGPVARTAKENVLLAGDAAGHVMATNGGGINVSMICGRFAAEAAADHVLQGKPLERYETVWRAAVGTPLDRGRRIKHLADRFFGSDRLLEMAMILLGTRRMARAIRCQPLFVGI